MKVMIVGGGKVGTHLAKLLLFEKYQVKVIECRFPEIERLELELGKDVVIYGDGTDPNLLEAANIRTMDVVTTVTGADEVNLVITSLARFEFRVPRVIARVNNPKNAWLFSSEMGVDVALDQSDIIGRLITEEMSLGDMMTLMKLRKGQYSLIEEKVFPTASAIGKPLREIQLPQKCVIAGVIRKDELIIPHGDTVLMAADVVLAIVHSLEIHQLAEILGAKN